MLSLVHTWIEKQMERKRKCKRVSTSNANAREVTYAASAVEVFIQDCRQYKAFAAGFCAIHFIIRFRSQS